MKNYIIALLILLSKITLAQENSSLLQDTDPTIISFINEIKPDSIRKNLVFLQDFKTRFMISPNRKQVAQSIKDKFITLGYSNTVLDSFQTETHFNHNGFKCDTTTWQYNVIAVLTGSQHPDSSIIIGGHYDSYNQYSNPLISAPGADDDGSAIALEFEIARVFKKMNYEPKKTIKFIAFAAEELVFFSTLSGSRYYAQQSKLNHEKIDFYLNNDMIANNSGTNKKVNIYSYQNSQEATDLALAAFRDYSTLSGNIVNGINGVDSYWFYASGFKTVYFEEYNFSPNYHSSNDIVDNCDINYCAEISKICTAMIMKGISHKTDIHNNPFAQQISIYPNPATQYLTIISPFLEAETLLSIYNANGQKVSEYKELNLPTKIDIGNLRKGMYILKFLTNDKVEIKKVIVE